MDEAGGDEAGEDDEYFDDDHEEEREEPIQLLGFEDQLVIDLDTMNTAVLDQNNRDASIKFLPDQTRSLNAVITDALARYDYTPNQLIEYMFDVMGIRI